MGVSTARLLTKLKDSDTRLSYAAATVEHGWSRNILTMRIKARVIERQGQVATNFDRTLPAVQSDLTSGVEAATYLHGTGGSRYLDQAPSRVSSRIIRLGPRAR